jgi:hypothetical protein
MTLCTTYVVEHNLHHLALHLWQYNAQYNFSSETVFFFPQLYDVSEVVIIYKTI